MKDVKLTVKSGRGFSSFLTSFFPDRFTRFFISLVTYFRENIKPVTWFEIYSKFLNSFLSLEDMFCVFSKRNLQKM